MREETGEDSQSDQDRAINNFIGHLAELEADVKETAISFAEEKQQPITEDEEEKEKTETYIQWDLKGGKNYIPIGKVVLRKKILPGVYKILYSREWGFYVSLQKLFLDELLTLPQIEQELILSDITKFWEKEELFKKYKYTYKRGILLYGPAGNGKSSIINLLSDKIVKKHKGVVFYLNSSNELESFCSFIGSIFRQIEANTPILCVLEDLETLTMHHETETLLLNTLDGAAQMNNIVFIGCTNYPESLKERILNRPNRFDRRYYIGTPSPEVRRYYFEKKLKFDDLKALGKELDIWVEKTHGFSIAHLGEIIKSVFVLGHSFEDTIETLEKMKQKISSHDFGKETQERIGFSTKGLQKLNPTSSILSTSERSHDIDEDGNVPA